MTDRAVMRQALEALEQLRAMDSDDVWLDRWNETIDALRAALAEPIPFSGAGEKPPVFGRRWRLADDGFGLQRDDNGPYVHIDDALSVLHGALAEPEQDGYCQHCGGKGCVACDARQHEEPVAWMVYTQDGKSVYVTDNPSDIQRDQRALPLYIHPPRQWQYLTDDEIQQITGFSWNNVPVTGYTRRLIDKIEAKIKEKNDG
jgi:hypothetical protein